MLIISIKLLISRRRQKLLRNQLCLLINEWGDFIPSKNSQIESYPFVYRVMLVVVDFILIVHKLLAVHWASVTGHWVGSSLDYSNHFIESRGILLRLPYISANRYRDKPKISNKWKIPDCLSLNLKSWRSLIFLLVYTHEFLFSEMDNGVICIHDTGINLVSGNLTQQIYSYS